MSSAVHFPCQISTVISSRGFNASPPTEHALMLIYTFSSVQYGGLVSNGPTVPWNIITCLFTDLQRKKEQRKCIKRHCLSGQNRRMWWDLQSMCTKSHKHIKPHWGFWVWHLFFCIVGREGSLWKNRAAPLWRDVLHMGRKWRDFHLLSTRLAKDWAGSTCWVSAW